MKDASLPAAFRLDGMVAAITGGAQGIGLETAREFIAAGARVAILDANDQAGNQAIGRLGESAALFKVDVSSESSVQSAFAAVLSHYGRLDVLVNNAGTAIRRPTLDLSLSDWQKVVDVNMTGVFLCAREAGRHMVSKKSGVIINMASIFGLSGGGLYPNISYQATKGAVVNMTRALAMEWAPHGVRVNAVAPTWVDTEFIAALKGNAELMQKIEQITPLGRLAKPAEVAHAVLFLASSASAMVTGHVLPVDGGFLAQ